MKCLPWLADTQIKEVDKRINATVGRALPTRHWGILNKPSELEHGRPSRFYILDYRGLLLASGAVRHALRDASTRLLYRGQTREYSTGLLPSLFRETANKKDRAARLAHFNDAMGVLRKWDKQGANNGSNEALAQHYGLKTHWLDVVDHVQMAAWFAYDLAGPPRTTNDRKFASGYSNHGGRDDAVGYIFLLAAPENSTNTHFPWIDLRTKGSDWLRPHVQQGFAVRMADPLKGTGNLDEMLVATFIVPRPLLRLWASYEHLAPDIIYPNIAEDRGLEYWNHAAEDLKSATGFDDLIWCNSA